MAEMNSYREDLLQVFEADLPWWKLSETSILVTGATGLIGGTLVDVLMSNPRRDYCVYASGRNVERAKERFGNYFGSDSFHFIQYDVMSPFEGDARLNSAMMAKVSACLIFSCNFSIFYELLQLIYFNSAKKLVPFSVAGTAKFSAIVAEISA